MAQAQGMVKAERLVPTLRQISAAIGYRYDDLDEAALTGALDDAEFDYPLAGIPALTVYLTRSADGETVSVRVESGIAMGLALAAKINALL
jgi:hypothetical protein